MRAAFATLWAGHDTGKSYLTVNSTGIVNPIDPLVIFGGNGGNGCA